MSKENESEAEDVKIEDTRRKRLELFLHSLEQQQAITQREVAQRVKVPAQYLSDVKVGRRPLSELFARRLHEEFGIDHQWLLGNIGSMKVPSLDRSFTSPGGHRVWLPVFAHPIAGDPFVVPDWDGSSVEIAGVAAARSLLATSPYVLRFGAIDRNHRLRHGDLVLISQTIDEQSEIQVLKAGRETFLARRNEKGQWERLNPNAIIRGNPTILGHCVGIVWGRV